MNSARNIVNEVIAMNERDEPIEDIIEAVEVSLDHYCTSDIIIDNYARQLADEKIDDFEAIERISAWSEGIAQEVYGWYENYMEDQ